MKNIALTTKKTLASCDAGEMFKVNGTKAIYCLESIVSNVYTVTQLRTSCTYICGTNEATTKTVEAVGRAF